MHAAFLGHTDQGGGQAVAYEIQPLPRGVQQLVRSGQRTGQIAQPLGAARHPLGQGMGQPPALLIHP